MKKIFSNKIFLGSLIIIQRNSFTASSLVLSKEKLNEKKLNKEEQNFASANFGGYFKCKVVQLRKF